MSEIEDPTDKTVKDSTPLPPEAWMVRPCEQYKAEFDECRGLRGRFHQYFIYGETLDCSQWKTDFNHCQQYIEKSNIDALNSLVASEKARKERRLGLARCNDVWEYRSSPPEAWNKPLEKTPLEQALEQVSPYQEKNQVDLKKYCVIS